MNSIENILNHIENNTKKEIEKIKNNCYLKCQKIEEEAKNIIEKENKLTDRKILTKKNELKNNYEVELKQIKNKIVLSKKDEILQKTINLAFNTFCEEQNEEYFNFIINLIKKNMPKEKTKIVFGGKDYIKFKEYYSKNYEIEVDNSFDYGFKFVCEKYILDFNILEIFLENSEKLKKIALNALNLKDVAI